MAERKRRPQVGEVWRRRYVGSDVRVTAVPALGGTKKVVRWERIDPWKSEHRRGGCSIGTWMRDYEYVAPAGAGEDNMNAERDEKSRAAGDDGA